MNRRANEIRFRSYKLKDIYERFHGREPAVQHTAEDDAISLLLCAIATKNEFIAVADSMARKFIINV